MVDADDFVDDANNDDDADDDDAYVLVLRWREPQLSKWSWRLHLQGKHLSPSIADSISSRLSSLS